MQKCRGKFMQSMAKPFQGNSKGVGLVEVLIAVAILGVAAAAFLSGVTSGHRATIIASERTNAESLARSEQEYVRNSDYWPFGFSYEIPGNPPPWDASHNILDSHYAGYSVEVEGVPVDPDHDDLCSPPPCGQDGGIQQITVEVYHQEKLVLTTSTYKVCR
jgi:prepilin-type N-terminal cleavage/methylation domain-containing protein